MKKIILLMLIFITGCTSRQNIETIIVQEKIEEKAENVLTEEFVDNKIKNMTMDEKIGQMIIIYNYTTNYNENLKNDIIKYQPGGFIVFSENAESFIQLSNLIENMQEDSKIPMLISVDQEGGRVQRLTYLNDTSFTIIPPMKYVGEKNNKELSYSIGKVLGSELNTLGINMDFAPVIDIASNPYNNVISDRAFGNNADIVSGMSISLAEGLQDENIIPVYKHFPGHGDTLADSHYSLPVLNKSKEELKNLELIPFKEAIKNDAQIIMVGHISIPKISGNTPASLSKEVITNILRKELNFNGVVITDAINMGAVTNNYSEKETIIMAINAGVDIILMPTSIENAINYIKDGLNENRITEEQINNSVKRIITLKYQNNLFLKNKRNNKNIIGSIEHKNIANNAY